MRTTEQLIADLKKERQELQGKIISLEIYLMNREYQELPPEERHNLDEQYETMLRYSFVLLNRVKRAQALIHQKELEQEAAELPEEMIPPETWRAENG